MNQSINFQVIKHLKRYKAKLKDENDILNDKQNFTVICRFNHIFQTNLDNIKNNTILCMECRDNSTQLIEKLNQNLINLNTVFTIKAINHYGLVTLICPQKHITMKDADEIPNTCGMCEYEESIFENNEVIYEYEDDNIDIEYLQQINQDNEDINNLDNIEYENDNIESEYENDNIDIEYETDNSESEKLDPIQLRKNNLQSFKMPTINISSLL